jgi:cytoskeletal protein RodZ
MGTLDNDQNENNSSPELLGEYLKQKRMEKNFTLEKLSQKTKISVNILKSLEANDFENLPSAAYIKGFVQSYVKVLGLPQTEAITKMEYTYLNLLGKPFPALNHTKLMGPSATGHTSSPAPGKPTAEKAPAGPVVSPHDLITNSDSIIENTKSILPVAIFACVILLFIGGYKLVSSIIEGEVNSQKVKDHGPRIETSSALVNQPVKKPEPVKTEEPAPVASATPTASASPVAVATPAPVEKPAPEIERNFPAISFSKVKGKLFTVKTDADENDDESIFPEKYKDKMNSDLQNVYIRATSGNTWISYKIDNNPIESVIINQGNDIFLQGSEIRLFLGNVNVTKIFYNNYLIETPTKSGVKSLIFPESSSSKYHLPLFPKAKDDIFYTAEDYMKRMKMEDEELGKKKPQ